MELNDKLSAMVHRGKNAGSNHSDPTTKLRGGPAKSNHLRHKHLHRQRDGRMYSMLSASVEYKRQRWNHIRIPPEQLPTSAFNAPDVNADIKLSGVDVDTLCHFSVRMVIQNPATSTANAVTQLSPYFFDRIEIQPDGGQTEDILYPENLLRDVVSQMSVNQKPGKSLAMGMNTGMAIPTVKNAYDVQIFDEDGYQLVPGEQREVYLEVHSMLTQSKMFIPAKKQRPRYKLFFSDSVLAGDLSNANAGLSLQQLDGIASGIVYESSVRNELIEHYASIPTISRVLVRERQIESISSITPFQVSSDKALNVFKGHFAKFDVILLKGNASRGERYDSKRLSGAAATPADAFIDNSQFVPLVAQTLTSDTGNPIFFNNIFGRYLQLLTSTWANEHSYIYYCKNIYPWTFCEDWYKTLTTGENTGGIALNTEFSLKVTPGNYLSTGETSYDLYINAYRYALLEMNDGAFSVSKL